MLRFVYFVAFYTLLRHEVMRFFGIWIQTLLPAAITTVLYFLIFGKIIGAQLSVFNNMGYIHYIVPGLIMMSVITNSYANVVGSLFSMRFQKNIEEILIAPIPHILIILAFTIGGIVRGLVTGTIVLFIGYLFTDISIQHGLISLIVIVTTAAIFSLAGFSNALLAKNFEDISIVPTFILTPLTYLGGVFYPLDSLPPFWRAISSLNPIAYMISALQYGFTGISSLSLKMSLTLLILMMIGLFYLNWLLIRRKIAYRY